MSESPNLPTAEAIRVDARAVALILCSLLRDLPTPDEWAVIESCAMDLASAARKGRSAAVLVKAANDAQAARVEQHKTAMTVQLDRMGMSETAGRLDPVFASILKAAGMQ